MYHGAADQQSVQHEPISETYEDVGTLTPLQAQYLSLLEHRLALKVTYQGDPGKQPWLLKIVDRSAYSTFRTCIELGVEAQARALLENQHLAN